MEGREEKNRGYNLVWDRVEKCRGYSYCEDTGCIYVEDTFRIQLCRGYRIQLTRGVSREVYNIQLTRG